MAEYPHGLTPGWSAEDIAADLVTLQRVLARYEALSDWQCVRHPTRQRRELIGILRYTFAAVKALEDARKGRSNGD